MQQILHHHSLDLGANRVEVLDFPHIDYQEAWDLQQNHLNALVERKVKARTEAQAPPPHRFLLCQHPPVYTLGRNGKMEHLLLSPQALAEQGFSFYKINRGGDITYHGPGQIVGYPILDLDHFFTDVARYVRSLEEVIIRTLQDFQLPSQRLTGASGVWLDADTPQARKICAIGVHLSRWVTMHGFALNVHTNLDHFKHIVPCGLQDKGVTSMQAELGPNCPSMQEVKLRIIEHFTQVFAKTP